MNHRPGRPLRRLGVAAGSTVAALGLLGGTALGAWTGTANGAAAAKAQSVGTVTGVSKTAATTTSVTIGWTRTATDLAGLPVTYVVTRTGRATPVCSAPAISTCQETGFTASSSPATYDYTVTPMLGGWTGTAGSVTGVGPDAASNSSPSLVVLDVADADLYTNNGGNTNQYRWGGSVTVTVHDNDGAAVEGVQVSGTWGDYAYVGQGSGNTGTGTPVQTGCTTDALGVCTIAYGNQMQINVASATYTVTGLTKTGYTYSSPATTQKATITNP